MALLLNQGDVVLRSYSYTKPSPTHPIAPEMCGVRTGNLFDWNWLVDGYQISPQTGLPVENVRRTAILQPIRIDSATGAFLSFVKVGNENVKAIYSVLAADDTFIRRVTNIDNGGYLDLTGGSKLYIAFYDSLSSATTVTKANVSNIMLNPGSTALPYEPYGWKVPFENHGENLFNIDGKNTGNGYQNNTQLYADGSTQYWSNGEISEYITVDGDTQYTLTNMGSYNTPAYCFYTENKEYISGSGFNGRSLITFTTPSNCKYVRFTHVKTQPKTMLTPGSTPKPYSPYLNETIPVYLGEVPTVRRVKKLVLDGTEEWVYMAGSMGINSYYRFKIGSLNSVVANAGEICTHYQMKTISTVTSSTDIGFSMQNSTAYNGSFAAFRPYSFSSESELATWKSYLASEYAAGTPVTVWYALSEPETTISNEPLAKIGDYADELTTIQVHGLSAPLYGIGDYKDTLNLATGVVTRKIKKLVLTGEENIEIKSGNAKWYIPIADMKTPASIAFIDWCCSHYQAVANNASWSSYDYMISWSSGDTGSSIGLRIRDIDFLTATTPADFKSYLAAQYQAGTPVTVWYVLNTPETETVTVPTGMTGEIEGYLTQVSTPTPTNRSVPKWNGVEETGGTYAVTVYTPPEIPTTTGENTLTVDTTLAPSNLTVKGHIKELT